MILATLETIITIPNILFALTFIGVIFSIYLHMKKPAEDLEHKQIVADEVLGTKATVLAQKEAEGKAQLLAQQVATEKEFNSKKFIEIGERFNNTDHKIEDLISSVNNMNLNLSKELMRIGTLVGQHLIVTGDNFTSKNV